MVYCNWKIRKRALGCIVPWYSTTEGETWYTGGKSKEHLHVFSAGLIDACEVFKYLICHLVAQTSWPIRNLLKDNVFGSCYMALFNRSHNDRIFMYSKPSTTSRVGIQCRILQYHYCITGVKNMSFKFGSRIKTMEDMFVTLLRPHAQCICMLRNVIVLCCGLCMQIIVVGFSILQPHIPECPVLFVLQLISRSSTVHQPQCFLRGKQTAGKWWITVQEIPAPPNTPPKLKSVLDGLGDLALTVKSTWVFWHVIWDWLHFSLGWAVFFTQTEKGKENGQFNWMPFFKAQLPSYST